MKTFYVLTHLALPALCIGLCSCESRNEKLANTVIGYAEDAADILLDCEDQEDIDKAVTKINKLTEEARQTVKEIETSLVELEKEREGMTRRKLKELDKIFTVKGKKADAKVSDSITQVHKIEGVNYEALDKAMTELAQVLGKLSSFDMNKQTNH